MDAISLLKMVPALYDASVNKGINAAVMLIGPVGHAKTTFCSMAAAALTRHTGREYQAYIREPMLYPYDEIRGIGIPQMADAGTENQQLIASYTWPTALPPRAEMKNAVLGWDELTKAPEDNVLALGNALLSRKLGDAEIPAEMFVVCTGNRAGMDKSKDIQLPAHVQARLWVVHWQLTHRSWEPWALKAGIHPLIQAYAKYREDRVFSASPPASRGEAFLTPRSLTEADGLIQSYVALSDRAGDMTYFPANDPALTEMLSGKVGAAAAEDLKAYALVGKDLPSWEDIYRKPKLAKVPDMGGMMGPPALHAVACMVAAKVDETTCGPAIEYIRRLPDEYQVPVILRMGMKYPAAAAKFGMLDLLVQQQDLAEAALIYQSA